MDTLRFGRHRGGAVAVVCMEPIPGLSDDTPQVIVPDTSAALPRIAAAFYGNPSTALTTVGVTGTNGKTTTTYIVRSILEAADMPCGVIGTTGYELEDVRLTPHGGVWEAEERDPTEVDSVPTPDGWRRTRVNTRFRTPHQTRFSVNNFWRACWITARARPRWR